MQQARLQEVFVKATNRSDVRSPQMVFASVSYPALCQDCGAESECHGVQALVDGRLRWDVEVACALCGFAAAICGGDLPSELRERILAEHGPATLQTIGAPTKRVVLLRVLRSELGLDLVGVKAVLGRVLSDDYTGTLPEVERLARKLRAAGIAAVAVRPGHEAQVSRSSRTGDGPEGRGGRLGDQADDPGPSHW